MSCFLTFVREDQNSIWSGIKLPIIDRWHSWVLFQMSHKLWGFDLTADNRYQVGTPLSLLHSLEASQTRRWTNHRDHVASLICFITGYCPVLPDAHFLESHHWNSLSSLLVISDSKINPSYSTFTSTRSPKRHTFSHKILSYFIHV
jgi:hypothetical protein